MNKAKLKKIIYNEIKDFTTKIPLTEEDSELLGNLVLSYMKDGDLYLKEENKIPLFYIIEKKLKDEYSFTLENSVILWLCWICENEIYAKIYLDYLQQWSKINNKDVINILDFCNIFPKGYPLKSDLLKINEILTSQYYSMTIN